jgi:hypothetical protein
MIHRIWRLSEGGKDNLGLACTGDGLILGHTPLIERRNDHFVVRDRSEIERLLSRAYRTELTVDRLMPGLATVAAALNANDQCLARIAAVHLRIPDLPDRDARDDMEAADALIKYARDEGAGVDWNPALHPRTGAPPNAGWFAPTGGSGSGSSPTRTAQNDNPTQRSDASTSTDDWVRLPPSRYPGEYIDELHDFVEWLANAKSEDERTIRAEIKRYYFDVGDILGGQTLHRYLSDALEAGDNKQWRQQIINDLASYAKTDPAVMGQMHGALPAFILPFPTTAAGALAVAPTVSEDAAAAARTVVTAETRAAVSATRSEAWSLGWAARGRYFEEQLGRTLHPNFPVIDRFVNGVATSIKSIDLNAAVYQDAARLAYRLNKYVEDVAEFKGGAWANDRVWESEITDRVLSLAIPKGSVSAIQRDAIEAARVRAKMSNMHKSVDIIITEF